MAEEIAKRKLLPAVAPLAYRRETQQVTNLGDIAEMLKLPPTQRLFAPQTVTIHPILTPERQLWEPTKSADVLVLGDSFFNIYSLGGMRWGEHAGFVEQLSYQLQRFLDRIVMNAGGSFATRQELAKRLAHGRDVLAGKRLVIYEFAMRDLAVGDWQLYPLEAKRPPVPATPATAP